MRIHVVAVAGTGMGALAGLLVELGHEVSGSDVAFDPPIGPALEEWGVRCLKGFDPRHLEPAPDLVVIGNVCRKDNPEAVAAFERGLEVTHIAGALERFALAGTSPLVVGGTHGKTTTSALAAWLLDATGRAPGFLIGGIPKNFGKSFRAARPRVRLRQWNESSERASEASRDVERSETSGGTGSAPPAEDYGGGGRAGDRKRPFVVEGDEYDTAFFEKTPKFWHYGAEVAIVTSIEHDHIDIYPSLEGYVDAFRRFVAGVPESGLIVANAADRRVVDVVRDAARAEVAWTALEGEDTHGVAPHWLGAPAAAGLIYDVRKPARHARTFGRRGSASEASDGRGGTALQGQSFDLFAGGVACGRLVVPAPGRHNLKNAIAALGAAAQGYGVPLAELGPALARFAGVRRRQDLLGEPGGVLVYDDFAHHPTAVRETLAALRARHPDGRLFAVFEPRSATACRKLHQAEYARSFDAADRVWLAPLGRSGLPEDERLDLERLARELEERGKPAELGSVDAIVRALAERARPGDVVALLSNGAFGGIHQKLLSALAA